jgi:signal transduction histidine kinase
MVQVCYLEERPESAEGPFLAEERNLIDGIAEQLGQVAERKKAQEVARFVSRKLLHVQEEERRSIARELHDEIGQQLTGLKLTIDALASRTSERQEQTAVLLQHILSDLINSARNLSTGLRPPMLEEFGLRAALDWLFDRVERQSNVCVKSDYTGLDRRFQPEVEIVVFRVVQESLNNVARHAQVDEADVQIDYYGQVLAIEIGDKGAGFDARAALASPATVGLVGMEERVTLLGGRFAVDSARGKGTRVRVRLPVQDQ